MVSDSKTMITKSRINTSNNLDQHLPTYLEATLPNVPELLDSINNILKYTQTNEMILLKKHSIDNYDKHLNDKFETFALKNPNMFKKIISGDDITYLYEMINKLERVKSGTFTLEEANQEIYDDFYSPSCCERVIRILCCI
jgi:hypothetical protein